MTSKLQEQELLLLTMYRHVQLNKKYFRSN